MTTRHASGLLGFLLLFTLIVPGCVKFKHAMTVNPDGSGKVEITFAMADAMLAHQDGNGFGVADLDELVAQEDRGFVAFTAPETWSEDGFTYQRFVGYFDRVNDVVIEGDETRGADEDEFNQTTFVFKAEEGTLTISRCLLQQVALETDDASGSDAAQRTAMAAMLGGMRIEELITLPGRIEDAGPFEAEGQTASGVIDDTAMLDEDATTLRAWRNSGPVVIKFEPTEWEQNAQAAWRDELAAAKSAWSAIKEAGVLGP